MIRVRKTAVATLAAVTGAALIAACGSSGSGGGDNAAKAPSKSTNNSVNDINAKPRSDLKTGGKITWGISQTIPNFNYYNVNGTLIDNYNITNALEPEPFLFNAAGAPSVYTDYFTSIKETSTSPETIEYKINPKAKWSNGRAIDWQDFYYLWKANNGTNSAFQIAAPQGYNQISSVRQGTNAQDVIVTFGKTYTDWQNLFAPLYPKELMQTPSAFNNGWVSKPTITAGPFKWGGENKTQQTYTVVRDPNWWGDKALLDSITFAAYNDPSAAVQALGQHELDYFDVSGGNAVSNVAALRGYKGVDVREAGGNNYRQFTFNTRDPLLSDIKVRQAIFLGIDRKAITTALIGKLGGNPTPLQNHFFMKNQTAYKDTCGDYCNYDPAKAKSILQSDGWTMSNGYFQKNGKQLSVAITIPSDTPNSKTEAQIAQNTLKAAGINLTIDTVPTNDFFSKYIIGNSSDPGKFQITTFTWIGQPFPVGSSEAIFLYNAKSKGQNYGFGGNSAINSLLEAAVSSKDQATEDVLANNASEQLWNNASWLPLYQRPQVTGVTSTVANLGSFGFATVFKFQDIGFTK